MTDIVFTVRIRSEQPASIARMCMFASRALDQQAQREGITTAELLDGNTAIVAMQAEATTTRNAIPLTTP